MRKIKKKWILIIFLATGLLTFLLYTYLMSGKQDTKSPAAPPDAVSNNETKTEDSNAVAATSETYKADYDLKKYFMDGSRESAEVKEKDYSDLLDKNPAKYDPKIPEKWVKNKTQVDSIDNYFNKSVEERTKLLKQKNTLTEKQKSELNKIVAINQAMSNAFAKKDYNSYLKYMYKGWREFYGPGVGGVIKSGEFIEKTISFYPEDIDVEIGYAYGFYVREITYLENGIAKQTKLTDGFIMYKQNDKGEWEVYLEKPFE